MSALTWSQINLSEMVSSPVHDPLDIYVKYPCDLDAAQIKVYLKSNTGSTLGRVDFKQTSSSTDMTGKMNCNMAYTKSYYVGRVTDFDLKWNPPMCKDGNMVLRVKKNTKCVQVIDANTKKVLWSKLFGSEQSDGACILPTSAVKVVVYGYTGNDMALAISEGEEGS